MLNDNYKKHRKIVKVLAVLIALFGFSLCATGVVHAAEQSSKASIVAKAIFEGVYQCANNGAYKSSWTWKSGKTLRGGESVGTGTPLFLADNLSSEAVKLPYGLTEVGDNNLNCGEILMGLGSYQDLRHGLIPENVKTSRNVDVVNYFAGVNKNGDGGIGYKAELESDTSGSTETQRLTYSNGGASCQNVNGQPLAINDFTGLVFPTITKSGSGKTSVLNKNGINVPVPGSGEIQEYMICGQTLYIRDAGDDSDPYYIISTNLTDSFISGAKGTYGKPTNIEIQNGDQVIRLEPNIEKGTNSDPSQTSNFNLTWLKSPMKMVTGLYNNNNFGDKYKTISGINSKHDSLKLTNQEVYDLYTYYITDVFKAIVVCDDNKNFDLYENDANAKNINWKSGQKCKIYLAPGEYEEPAHLYGVNNDNRFVSGPLRIDDIIDRLNKLDLSKLNTANTSSLSGGDDPINGGEDEPQEVDPTCENSGAAESLGWIVCPVLSWLSTASESMYEEWIEPALYIPPTLFTEGNNAVLNAWTIFQGFANIAMIIILLIVIFSQITGVGINNYGIKKILPKLIIAAVLINLSYIICQALVDVSNIVGNAVQDIFNSYHPDNLSDLTVDSTGIGSVAMTGLTGVALLVALAASVWSAYSGGGLQAILLALLVSALTIIVSIFFLFILLSARQAAVVVLTVISPLAFACIILPNTKKLFDKWVKFGQGLLLVYPICGLLVGGGNFISKLLLGSTGSVNFFQAFTAMIIGVVPIFFIPTVLKNSLNAVGNIGAKISGIGKNLGGRLSGGVDKGIRNSAGYQERAKQAQEDIAQRRAKRITARLGGKDYDKLNKYQKRSLYNAQQTLIADKDAESRAKNMAGSGFAAAETAIQKKADAEDVANHMVLINSETQNGADEKRLASLFNGYMNAGDLNGAVAVARIAGRRKDTASRFLDSTLMSQTKYDAGALAKVAKEISEGENSKNFRSASPLGFEYATHLNKGQAKDAKGLNTTSYADWKANAKNVSDAMNHHVTDSSELVGTQRSNLEDIAKQMELGNISPEEANRVQALARDSIANRDKGPWDTTKAAEIYRIAYGENYQQQMAADGIPMTGKQGSVPDGIYKIRGASGEQTIIIHDGQAMDQNNNKFDNSEYVVDQVRQIVNQRNNGKS